MLNRQWLVRDSSGQVIGGLDYRIAAHEKRRSDNPRARRRWIAPGWVYYSGGGDPMELRPTAQAPSKRAALEAMLRRAQERAASA